MAARDASGERIGIFGGTFDPPHRGHVALIEAARDALDLTTVLVVPTAVPPHRPTPIGTPTQRRHLAQLAFGTLNRVEMSDLEARDGTTTYTADTVDLVHAERPRAALWVLLGADGLVGFTGWQRYRDIGASARIAVVGRPQLVTPDRLAEAIAELRAQGLQIDEVPMDPVHVSATRIRDLIERKAWDELASDVPTAIRDTIAAYDGI